MRRGPKFEITLEMAVYDVQTVARRLGLLTVSAAQYQREGSFALRSIQRKFGWRAVVQLAGLTLAKTGRPRRLRKPCLQGCGRTNHHVHQHCRTCLRRLQRLGEGLEVCA